jgi:hypothetical protein
MIPITMKPFGAGKEIATVALHGTQDSLAMTAAGIGGKARAFFA